MIKYFFLAVILAASFVGRASAQWVQLKGLDTTLFITSLASNGNGIYTCDRTANFAPDAVYTSSDNGKSWTKATEVSGVLTLAAIGPWVFGGSLFSGLFLTPDSGAIWGHAFCCWQGQNAVWSGGNKLFFSGDHFGVNISNDSGRTWHTAPAGMFPMFGLDSLLIGSDSLRHVLRSTDLGITWSQVSGLPDSPYYQIAMSGSVLLATNGTTIFRSTDGGMTWTSSVSTLPNTSLNVLTVNAAGVFVATGSGVYQSTNGGLDWKNWNDGLGRDTVTCFTINDKYIFAGTQGQGVWRRALSELSSVSEHPTTENDLELYPNPTTGIVTIHNAPDGLESISIMNILGERVMEIPSLHQADITFDLSKLSSGVYYVRIVASSSVTTKMIVRE